MGTNIKAPDSVLDNVKLGFSAQNNSIFLYRQGKDENEVLEQKEIHNELLIMLIAYMCFNSPQGSIKDVTVGGKKYQVIVRPVGEVG